MAKIQITEGLRESSSTDEYHLVTSHLLDPNRNIDKLITYAEQRFLMTFFVSGTVDSRYTSPGFINTNTSRDTAETMIEKIPDGELMDGNAWKYKVQGRIQKAVEIVGTSAIGIPTTGSSTAGGFVKLALKDNSANLGDMVTFYNGNQARVTSQPTRSGNNYIYNLNLFPGDIFDFATWIAPQGGTKTLFVGYNTFGERSLKGFGNVFFGDEFINHTTKQRVALDISGDANANRIIWYQLNNSKGFVFESEAQTRAKFLLQDDFQKMWGKSTMKDEFGSLLSVASMTDIETGQPVVAGDGWLEQVRGANDAVSSGPSGDATYDDFSDMVTAIRKNYNDTLGKRIWVRTGSAGMANANRVIREFGANNFRITQNIDQDDSQFGGAAPTIGFDFVKLNVSGTLLHFVEDPQMDDEQKFPARLSDASLRQSKTFYFIDNTPDPRGKRNIEIKARGREGVNRNMVSYIENGMTGEGKAMSSVDAKRMEFFKENMLVVYRTNTSGILEPSLNA